MSSYLKLELISYCLKLFLATSSQLGQLHMNTGSDGGAEVGGTECQHSQSLVWGEWNPRLYLLHPLLQPGKHLANIATHLHADDPEVVLLPAPHQECLAVVVEDSSSCWPVSAGIGSLEKPVSLLQQKTKHFSKEISQFIPWTESDHQSAVVEHPWTFQWGDSRLLHDLQSSPATLKQCQNMFFDVVFIQWECRRPESPVHCTGLESCSGWRGIPEQICHIWSWWTQHTWSLGQDLQTHLGHQSHRRDEHLYSWILHDTPLEYDWLCGGWYLYFTND